MAVRRIKKSKPREIQPSEPPPREEEEPVRYAKSDLGVRDAIRSLRWWGSSTKEIAARIAEQFGISESNAKKQIYIVRAEDDETLASVLKTGRKDQILAVRRLSGKMEMRLATALAEEAKAKKELKEYRPSRLVPTYSELLKCHDLSADLEGNRAPTRQISVTADVSQGVLELLGLQSPEEVSELLAEGRKILRDRNVIDVEGSDVG